jgi:hypothetical protein
MRAIASGILVFAALLPLEAQGAISCSTRTVTTGHRVKVLGATIKKDTATDTVRTCSCVQGPSQCLQPGWCGTISRTLPVVGTKTVKTCVKNKPFCC